MDVQSICSVLQTSLSTLHIFRPMSFSTSNTECHCEVLENVSAELQTFMFEVYDVGLVNMLMRAIFHNFLYNTYIHQPKPQEHSIFTRSRRQLSLYLIYVHLIHIYRSLICCLCLGLKNTIINKMKYIFFINFQQTLLFL